MMKKISFDIEKINKTLDAYPKLVNKIKSMYKKGMEETPDAGQSR